MGAEIVPGTKEMHVIAFEAAASHQPPLRTERVALPDIYCAQTNVSEVF
jgi:hypothetical protein